MNAQIQDLLPVLVAVVALATSLARIIEVLIKILFNKISKKKSEPELIKDVLNYLSDEKTSTLSEEERYFIKNMHTILSKCDEHGVPLCYSSREVLSNLKEIAAILNKISANEEKITILLEYTVNRINNDRSQ